MGLCIQETGEEDWDQPLSHHPLPGWPQLHVGVKPSSAPKSQVTCPKAFTSQPLPGGELTHARNLQQSGMKWITGFLWPFREDRCPHPYLLAALKALSGAMLFIKGSMNKHTRNLRA